MCIRHSKRTQLKQPRAETREKLDEQSLKLNTCMAATQFQPKKVPASAAVALWDQLYTWGRPVKSKQVVYWHSKGKKSTKPTLHIGGKCITKHLCGLVVIVSGYITEMYSVSCEVRTEFIYVMQKKVDRLCGLVVKSSWLHNGDVFSFLWGTNWIYICYVEESRPPLWSSGQSSWLHNGDLLCFMWGTNW
jgi:hypothetical protein